MTVVNTRVERARKLLEQLWKGPDLRELFEPPDFRERSIVQRVKWIYGKWFEQHAAELVDLQPELRMQRDVTIECGRPDAAQPFLTSREMAQFLGPLERRLCRVTTIQGRTLKGRVRHIGQGVVSIHGREYPSYCIADLVCVEQRFNLRWQKCNVSASSSTSSQV